MSYTFIPRALYECMHVQWKIYDINYLRFKVHLLYEFYSTPIYRAFIYLWNFNILYLGENVYNILFQFGYLHILEYLH